MQFKTLLLASLLFLLMPLSTNADELRIRNPSQPLLTKAPAISKKQFSGNGKMRLSFIFVGKDKRMATINGKAYGEGDSIGAYSVKKINSDHVVITSIEKTRTLSLFSMDKSGFVIK